MHAVAPLPRALCRLFALQAEHASILPGAQRTCEHTAVSSYSRSADTGEFGGGNVSQMEDGRVVYDATLSYPLLHILLAGSH